MECGSLSACRSTKSGSAQASTKQETNNAISTKNSSGEFQKYTLPKTETTPAAPREHFPGLAFLTSGTPPHPPGIQLPDTRAVPSRRDGFQRGAGIGKKKTGRSMYKRTAENLLAGGSWGRFRFRKGVFLKFSTRCAPIGVRGHMVFSRSFEETRVLLV